MAASLSGVTFAPRQGGSIDDATTGMNRHSAGMMRALHRRGYGSTRTAVLVSGGFALFVGCAGSAPAAAQRIENSVAVFAALDKVTAKISRLEVPLGQTASFGALKVTPRVCYTRAPTEPPKTTTFVEVEEKLLDGKEKRIFSGWMFADAPGLNAVEHPVFDVWLTDCSHPRAAAPRPAPATKGPGPAAAPEPDLFEQPRRRRVPR